MRHLAHPHSALGWMTGQGIAIDGGLRSRPRAFLDIPSVTVDAWQRLVPSCEAALHVQRGRCSPSRVSGCTSHSETRSLHRDTLLCLWYGMLVVSPGLG